MTSVADRLRYAYAAFKAGEAVIGAAQQITAALPPSNSTGGIMQAVPIQTLEAATAFLTSDPRAATMISLAKTLAGGQGASFIEAVKVHDWATVATDVLTDGLTAAANLGVPYAGLALKLIPAVIWAAHHPASVESPAMEKATGPAGNPWDKRAGGAYPTGGVD